MSEKKSHQAIGIDLGTTFSVVAHLNSENRPETIRNAEGDPTTPSVIYYDRNGPVVGKEAVKVAPYEPELVSQWAKREMGNTTCKQEIRGQKLPPEVPQALSDSTCGGDRSGLLQRAPSQGDARCRSVGRAECA